jgi:hypothetical protein
MKPRTNLNMKLNTKTATFLLGGALFLLGLRFYATQGGREGFLGNSSESGNVRCPDLLIQQGASFFLYNTKVARVPGVNPVEFSNLEEYTEFLEWQRSQGIRCPVLYFQKMYDTQGNEVFKARPSVSDLRGGLPPNMASGLQPNRVNAMRLIDAARQNYPINDSAVASYDPANMYIGVTTPLDDAWEDTMDSS